MYRIEATHNGKTYHLNETYSSGGIGNRIALIDLTENFTEYQDKNAANEAINIFERSNQHQKVERFEIIKVQ